MPSSSSLSLRKNYFLSDSKIEISNNHLDEIKISSDCSKKNLKSFEEVLKIEGIAHIFMDPSETHLQLIHHDQV